MRQFFETIGRQVYFFENKQKQNNFQYAHVCARTEFRVSFVYHLVIRAVHKQINK